MSIRFLKNGSNGNSSDMSLNIFVQPTEPEIKKGLWLQKQGTFENVYGDDDIYIEGEWITDDRYGNIPFEYRKSSNSCSSGATAIGDDIYMFEGNYTGNLYKYNTKNKEFTKLSNINELYQVGCIADGDYIYYRKRNYFV